MLVGVFFSHFPPVASLCAKLSAAESGIALLT